MSMKRSLLLGRRLSGLCLGKQTAPAPAPALQASKLGGTRFMSETPPCHIVGAERCGDGSMGRLVINDYTLSSPGRTLLEKTVPIELLQVGGTIGASHGWVATLKDGVVTLQDDLNPAASASQPKRISLPPLAPLPHCQTQLVTNIALSSSSPDLDPDCVLAVKFLGPQLSLCRPALKDKSQWVHIRIQDPSFSSSHVMFSKAHNTFSMLSSGGRLLASWDLEKNLILRPLKSFIPHQLVPSRWERVTLRGRSEHLVEMPSGQRLMVKWYKNFCERTVMPVWERFMVYSIQENKAYFSTTYIGDYCIFLSSKGEPFCLKASLYGLSPNSIYYVSNYDFGKVNIADNVRVGGDSTFFPAPYFIPPSP